MTSCVFIRIQRQEKHTEAERWWRLAAEQGHDDAQASLGVMYTEGQGVPQDAAEGERWYRLAADQGYGLAQINTGFIYASGRGVPQDYVQAHMWYNLAASRLTGEDRDLAIQGRENVANRLTPEQRVEAQRLAREWDEAHPPD